MSAANPNEHADDQRRGQRNNDQQGSHAEDIQSNATDLDKPDAEARSQQVDQHVRATRRRFSLELNGQYFEIFL